MLQRFAVIVFALALCLLIGTAVAGDYATPLKKSPDSKLTIPVTYGSTMNGEKAGNYTGHLKVYMVEPTSRWRDSWFVNYDYGFLRVALDIPLDLPYLGVYSDTIQWDGTPYGYGDITETNIAAIAYIQNPESFRAYSDPDEPAYPFEAYPVEAAAMATPGIPGSDIATGNSTHTTMVHEGTTTW